MKLLALAVSLQVNLANPSDFNIRVSPQLSVPSPYICNNNSSYIYGMTMPLVTVYCDKLSSLLENKLLIHENYHFWNHYGQLGLAMLPAYAVASSSFEDYEGAHYTPINRNINYYLFGYDSNKGFNIYQQVYFK